MTVKQNSELQDVRAAAELGDESLWIQEQSLSYEAFNQLLLHHLRGQYIKHLLAFPSEILGLNYFLKVSLSYNKSYKTVNVIYL